MKKGILLVGHGSRSKIAQEEFAQVVAMVKEKSTDIVEGAHMELCEPSIYDGVKTLVEENPGLELIAIVPYFLFTGIHLRRDIPDIIEDLRGKYPNIEFKFGRPLGAEEHVADILLSRAAELL